MMFSYFNLHLIKSVIDYPKTGPEHNFKDHTFDA